MRLPNIILISFALTTAFAATSGCSEEPAPVSAKSSAESPAPQKRHEPNRLARESSPYLLLHQHNPVDWYPWGPEAFEKAKTENKPIFLSIGYSSCYWCHVMERLVFENEEIAKYMNEHFVNIKVDREERPDVDDIYMTSLIVYFQLIGSPQGGGWPLSMFMTPEGQPFAGGSYFPPEDQGGRLGFPTVMQRVHTLWTDKETDIRQNAKVVTDAVQRQMKPRLNLEETKLDLTLVELTVNSLKESYDSEYGGIDFRASQPNSPKFPVPAKLRLLLDRAIAANDEDARKIVLHTLTAIARGGIRDHLGGGFHRYSTDREWLVPHFEKMLYDQGQLVSLYLEAWKLTQDPLFEDAARSTLDFLLAEMTDEAGGFYSALDAETETIEGKYYVWDPTEIETSLGEDDYKLFAESFGLTQPNPFEHGYVLHLPRSVEESAKKLGISEAELQSKIAPWKKQLLTVRKQRKYPLLDDKVLTSWNGLTIRAFAEAGSILEEPLYTAAAEKAANFIRSEMTDDEGHLYRSWREGKSKLNAYLDDYAFLIEGMLALHNTTGDEKWLGAAEKLQQTQLELFWDKTGKGFYFTSHDHEELIARTKNSYDAVIPAGNSVSALNLIALTERTGKQEYRERAGELFGAFAGVYRDSPRGMSVLSLALTKYLETGDGVKQSSRVREPNFEELVPVAFQSDEEKKHLVKLVPYLDVDKLPAGNTCQIVVYVEIEKDWHINTNPASPDFFIPTVLKVKSDVDLKLKGVVYPAGKKFTIEGLDDPLMVYEGKIAIRGELDIPETAVGKKVQLDIELDYQACNDSTCKPKATISLGGKVPVANAGETIKKINSQHFPKK
ncbi:MAG TPA: DUF255 domain-containing protein [Planctomycetaceae bacterium]|nr:DUF255 domain-containing protein [Planctomycetaceae bacterium]